MPDVEGQFAALKHHGEALGWILPEDQGAPDPSVFDHYQGVVRYPGAGTPVFYVTQKDDDDNGVLLPPGFIPNGGYLDVVRMGTRGTDGERLRSNLQALGADTEDTSPAPSNTWISAFHFDGQSGVVIDGQTLRPYVHPGGMAIADNILFVAMDTPNGEGIGGEGEIVLFDLGANGELREAPVPIQSLELDHSIDNVAVTLIGHGTGTDPFRYIVWTNGAGGESIHVYETNGPDLRDENLALDLVQTWNPASASDFDPGFDTGPFPQQLFWPTGSGAHQSSTFIRQFDGANPSADAPLYMIGMRRDGLTPFTGEDKGDLYRVEDNGSGGLKLTLLRTIHFFTDYDGAGHIGNFAAASGGYVSPSGELILYNVPHDDQDGFDPDFVRMAEIRHRDVNREGSPLRLPAADAGGPYSVGEGGSIVLGGSGTGAKDRPWVELYDDDHFEDRSIVVDFDDRGRLELNNFDDLDNFGDKTSSVRWRLPPGMSVELFEDHDFGGHRLVLDGTGETKSIANLDSVNFGDATSSMRFVGTPPSPTALTFTWDLDGDGVFGETGAAAANGGEVGASPTFQAGALDGPGARSVALRVTDATGAAGTATTTVNLTNAPPTAAVSGDTFGVPGMPRHFNLSATDPSAADTLAGFTFAVDFGDGSTTIVNPGDPPVVQRAYAAEGVYTVSVVATDKDGGISAPATLQIAVKAAGILSDPTDPTKTALAVGGTAGADVIKVIQQGKTGAYEVKLNGQSKGVFPPTGRIIIFGQAGDDSIDVPNSVSLPVEMYGGDGNDTMSGGAGPDLLLGEAGNDVLSGGGGRDVLLGGAGVDRLGGNADDDVLIGSATIHDADFAAVHAIQKEWLRTDITASVRSSHLLDGTGLNGPSAKLDAASILDDGVADLLSGASGENFVRQ